MGYKVAVVGATGAVGHAILECLNEIDFPIDQIEALASSASLGKASGIGTSGISA